MTGDRFDHIRNMVDWDYTMRLVPAGIPGVDTNEKKGSVMHVVHFRGWRITGLGYVRVWV